jgi:hypothetical protein
MMSVEQWGLLALVLILPLLEALARFRRAHASDLAAGERTARVRPLRPDSSPPDRAADDVAPLAATPVASSSLPPPLPPRLPLAAISLSRPSANRASSTGSALIQADTTNGKSVATGSIVRWLRPVGSLRHAIIVATIVGPPSNDGRFDDVWIPPQ